MDASGSNQRAKRPRTRSMMARAAQEQAAVSARTRSATSSVRRNPARSSKTRPRRVRAANSTLPVGTSPAPLVASTAAGIADASSAGLPEVQRSRGERNFSRAPQTPSIPPREQISEELTTPKARTGGDCGICLSPLKKCGGSNQPQQQQEGNDIYRIQACGHTFHRACLVQSRQAGNRGCPNCRGELERGLTPAAAAEEQALSAARQAAMDSATSAVLEACELFTAVASLHDEAEGEAHTAAATAAATTAAARTQLAVAEVLAMVHSRGPPSAAMYLEALARLQATRMEIRRAMLVVAAAEARGEVAAAEGLLRAAEVEEGEARQAARDASRAARVVGPTGSGSEAAEARVQSSRGALAAALHRLGDLEASLATAREREAAATRALAAMQDADDNRGGDDSDNSDDEGENLAAP